MKKCMAWAKKKYCVKQWGHLSIIYGKNVTVVQFEDDFLLAMPS